MTAATLQRPSSFTPQVSFTARVFPVLIGLTSVGLVAQSLMAGVFLQTDGSRDSYSSWITAHGIGADVTSVLALLATISAFLGFRGRRSLGVASAALLALILLESLLGHLINGSIGGANNDKLTIVHIPLGMLLLSLATWLSVQAVQIRRHAG